MLGVPRRLMASKSVYNCRVGISLILKANFIGLSWIRFACNQRECAVMHSVSSESSNQDQTVKISNSNFTLSKNQRLLLKFELFDLDLTTPNLLNA